MTANEWLGTSHGPPPAGRPLRTGRHILGNRHTAANKQTPNHVASHTCCQNSKRKEPSEAISACSPLPHPALMSESSATEGLQFPASHSKRNGRPGQDQSAPQDWKWLLPQRGPGAPAPSPTLASHVSRPQRNCMQHELPTDQRAENELGWKQRGCVRPLAADPHTCLPLDFSDISCPLLSPVRGPFIPQSPGFPGTGISTTGS